MCEPGKHVRRQDGRLAGGGIGLKLAGVAVDGIALALQRFGVERQPARTLPWHAAVARCGPVPGPYRKFHQGCAAQARRQGGSVAACFVIGMLDAGRVNTGGIRLPPGACIAIFSGFVVLAAILVRDYFLAEEDFRVARFEALKVGQTPESYERPRLILLNQLGAMSSATRVVPTAGMTNADIELLRKAALHYPWTAIQHRYALALALNGNLPEAERQLKVMRAMHGEKMHAAIMVQWQIWAQEKHPQLQGLASP